MTWAKQSVKRLKGLTQESTVDKMKITLGLDIDEEEGFEPVKVAKFKRNNKIRVAWELIMTVPMWYSMITTPFFILWPEYHEKYLLGLWITDIMWLFDLFFNFLKVQNEMDITFY
jgi:hypothetical protein